MIKKISILLLLFITGIAVLGCNKKTKLVNGKSGESTAEERAQSWAIRDEKENTIAVITAPANGKYRIADQRYDGCDIVLKNEEPYAVGTVIRCMQLSPDDDIKIWENNAQFDDSVTITEKVKEKSKNGTEYTLLNIVRKDLGTEYYCIFGNEKNTIEIKMTDYNLERFGLKYISTAKELVDLIELQ